MTSFFRAVGMGMILGLGVFPGSTQAADENIPGLVGWWKLDQSTGAADSAGNLNGALHEFFPSPFVTGLFGEALLFTDGSYVSFPSNHEVLDLKSFTFSAWVKVDYLSQETTLAEWSDGNSRWVLGVSAEGVAQVKFIHGSQVQTVSGGKEALHLIDGQWHLIVLVMDAEASKATLYVNDYPEGEATIKDWAPSAVQSFLFGNPTATSLPCYFALDETKLYSRGLSSSEIGQLASAYYDAYGKSTGSGSSSTSSGTSNSGTTSSSTGSSTERPLSVDNSKVGHYIYASIANGANDHDGLSPVVANGHGPKASIRAAIDAAASGDTIIILSGTYAESIPDTGSKRVTFCPEGNVILR